MSHCIVQYIKTPTKISMPGSTGMLEMAMLPITAGKPAEAETSATSGVYRRPYFTGLRISTQTVSFTIDNFSSFLTQNRTLTALYTFLLLSGPPSDFIEDVELWLSTALIFNNRPSITSPHKQAFHGRGVFDISPPWR